VDPSRNLRILLIDDDQGDLVMTRALIDQIGRAEIAFDWVSTFEEGLEALKADRHDVYLVDYFLEDRDGLELVRQARDFGTRKPIIMLTGRGSEALHVEAMSAGASAYLVKGQVDADRLEHTIRHALERAQAETPPEIAP
jgi:DNA-binding response OmpR family regulator